MLSFFTYAAEDRNYFFRLDQVSDLIEGVEGATVHLLNGRHYTIKDSGKVAELKTALTLPFAGQLTTKQNGMKTVSKAQLMY